MFKIHATVLSDNVEQFKQDCIEFGCKPLLIELQNQSGSTSQQLMTSQSFRHSNWDLELNKIKDKLQDKNYELRRLKVEINPYAYSDVNIKYYETHLRIKTSKSQEDKLVEIIKEFNFHKSKNIFKRIDDMFFYQMATYRTYDLDIKKFESVISDFKSKLSESGFEYDKIEVEACIIDTNDLLDKEWLTKN